MRLRRLSIGAVVVAVIATSTSCLVPNQHTLVGISAAHNTAAAIDTVTFTYQQGAPSGGSARYVSNRPITPTGKPVGVDGNAFILVTMNVAVAHDLRGLATSPIVFYPTTTSNVLQVARFEDFQGHVGYVIGLRTGSNPRVSFAHSANAVVVSLSAPG
ncbi:MAG TPA: hypothetical protein VHX15_15535 [Frankiaceae bacterium]|jgi:hypothetical protein|nr:hypothetical protein [Frankiaceae bacterium]